MFSKYNISLKNYAMPLIFVLDERYNPGLSFNTKDDLTNAFSGKLLQLESQVGRCQNVCDFGKKVIFSKNDTP